MLPLNFSILNFAGRRVEHSAQAGLSLPRRVLLNGSPALRELPRGRGPLAIKLNHKIIRQWLENYHRRLGDGTANSTHQNGVPGALGQRDGSGGSSGRYISAQEMQSIAEQQKQKQEQKEALQGAGEQGQPQACQLAAHRRVAPKEPRPNLVLVPVGDTFNASKYAGGGV